MPWLALKILPSGYVGTSPWSTKDGEGRAKALSTGVYAFYQEKEALSVGIQDPNVPNRATFTSVRDCLQVRPLQMLPGIYTGSAGSPAVLLRFTDCVCSQHQHTLCS